MRCIGDCRMVCRLALRCARQSWSCCAARIRVGGSFGGLSSGVRFSCTRGCKEAAGSVQPIAFRKTCVREKLRADTDGVLTSLLPIATGGQLANFEVVMGEEDASKKQVCASCTARCVEGCGLHARMRGAGTGMGEAGCDRAAGGALQQRREGHGDV